MADRTFDGTARGINVGGVFGRSLNVIRTNPVATLGLAFALTGAPQLVVGALGGQAGLVTDVNNGSYWVLGVAGVISVFLWLVMTGALVHATVAHDQERTSGFVETLLIGFRRCLPLLAVSVLFTIAVSFGLVFIIVPGIILGVMWSVSIPAVAAERTGVFGAFGRSRMLTKGARWQVFGILLLALVIYSLSSAVVGIMGVAGHGSLRAALSNELAGETTPSLFVQLVQAIVTTVAITWYTTVLAALFVELRHWKDGPDTDRLTDIFS